MKKARIPRAILFDLDDTILSDDAVSEEAWRETCEILADRVKPTTGSELFSAINTERIIFWNDPVNLRDGAWRNLYQSRLTIVKKALTNLGRLDDAISHEIVDTYNDFKSRLVRLLPNAEHTLNTLKERGIKLALLTNGEAESQRAKVEKLGLQDYFPVCLIEGELGFGKPDPRIFQLALDNMHAKPSEAWMLGDRLEFDIIGAQNMGIKGIWCDYQRKGLPADSKVMPDVIIHDISELLNLTAES
jgi:putative hydrolase of the HAD superfamily